MNCRWPTKRHLDLAFYHARNCLRTWSHQASVLSPYHADDRFPRSHGNYCHHRARSSRSHVPSHFRTRPDKLRHLDGSGGRRSILNYSCNSPRTGYHLCELSCLFLLSLIRQLRQLTIRRCRYLLFLEVFLVASPAERNSFLFHPPLWGRQMAHTSSRSVQPCQFGSRDWVSVTGMSRDIA